MPLNPAFSINATPPINPAQITVVDTSTGSDVSIASRQLLIFLIDNTQLIPATAWQLAQSSLSITPLTQDLAASLTVNWLAADGVTILYTSSQIFVFTGFSELFMYQLTQNQTSQPNIVVDENYYKNKEQLRCELDAAVQAISVGVDIYSAQSCINRASYMITNSNLFF